MVLVNDLCTGTMGERVLWDYMLDHIPDLVGIDERVVPKSTDWAKDVREYINTNHPDNKIIIQNATFIPIIDESKFTIVYLQDNLRGMNRHNMVQENTLDKADMIITNSEYTAASYPEFDMGVISIGIDETIFKPTPREPNVRPKGIFVGALNEVKGWNEVKSIIDTRKDIDWIVVTKHNNSYNTDNCTSYSRIDQPTLASLHNQADFFIVGSPIETQCLAALEAGFCDIPIVMHNTGIFADMTPEERSKLGYFGIDLNEGINYIIEREFNVRDTLVNMDFSVYENMMKWTTLIQRIKWTDAWNEKYKV